jgi:DNA-directed RNA polymerase subunit M
MKFCPQCSTRLRVKQVKSDDNVLVTLQCDRCGFSAPAQAPIARPEAEPADDQIKVVGEEVDVKPLPTTQVECPKCENKEAYWWMLQTRSGDEATTQFFRCTKCGHTWREYS